MTEFLAAREANEIRRLAEEAERVASAAWAQPPRRSLIAFAARALELSPICIEAYVVLASDKPMPDEAIALLRLGLVAAELSICAGIFTRESEQIRHNRLARSYINALHALATRLWSIGEYEEGLVHHREILALDPEDDMGIRHQFAARLFERKKFGELWELIDRFDNDPALERYRPRVVEAERQQSADALHACAAYLSDLQSLLRPRFTDREWNDLFDGTATPEKAARSVLMGTAGLPERSSQFWTLLDLSTAHLRPGDIALFEQYRGPDWEGERDRDPGQTLFLSPVVGGWLITTADCMARRPDHMLTPAEKAELTERRREVITGIRSEGFSEEFIALFKYAYENMAPEIRFHRDADYISGFPRFDLHPWEEEKQCEDSLASGT